MHPLNRPEVMVPFAQDRIRDGTVTNQKTRDLIRQLLEGLVMWAMRLQRGVAAQKEKTVKAA
jgi:chromate reductase